MRRTHWRLTFCLAAAVLTGAALASPRLQVVPDADLELAAGWSAYSAGDLAQARRQFLRAAERNGRVAQFNLAVMLLAGEGGVADPVAGVAWLQKSATGGFARAQFALGLLHESGEGVARSLTEATAWYHKAAEQGYRDAQVSLATQYFLGRGAPLDYAQAALWYERAAEQGDPGAAYIIASQYEHGDGVGQDLRRAVFWYSMAAGAGDPVAALKAREVAARISTR